jgi:phosphoglycerate kinase
VIIFLLDYKHIHQLSKAIVIAHVLKEVSLTKLSVKDLELKDKKVLMRVDFNVPFDSNGEISDDTRIQATLTSIHYILDKGAKLILMSHLGKPKGFDPNLSLVSVQKRLSELLKKPVIMAPDCVGPDVEKMASQLKNGEILLLENLRFHEAEEKPENDLSFAKSLSTLGDVFVNDAFGTAHRAHSSTAKVASYFPDKSAAGFLMEKEIKFLGEALLECKRPFYALIGGAKVSSKLGIIESLLNKVDVLLIGGAMAYTFLKAKGLAVGNSLVEHDLIEKAREILELGSSKNIEIVLPVDHVITNDLKGINDVSTCSALTGIPDGYYGVDIGYETIKLFSEKLNMAATVLWNGPLGIFEIEKFSKGTASIAEVIANLNVVTIVGGGDSVAALQKTGLINKISHVSTGGGASLEYIEFGSLPGIDALSEVKKINNDC